MDLKIKSLIVAALVTAFGVSEVSAQSPKREMRSSWMATVWAIDWPASRGTSSTNQANAKAQMTKYLDSFEAMNMNGICIQVRSMCDAMYQSSYEPWSSFISGTRGTNPGWDPLAWIVDECHKRGLECYAWVNPYRWSTGTNYNTSYDQQFKNNGWILTYNSTSVLNPGLPAVREHIVKVCREIVENYKIDGMLFDDYFYPNGIPTTSAADDYTLYKSSGTTKSFADWRRANVNLMVKNVYDMIQSVRPDVRFGIGPAGVVGNACTSAHGIQSEGIPSQGYQYNGIFSDPVAWLEEGTIDFISPQIYWFTTSTSCPYGTLTKWWGYAADHYGRHHYASHSISYLESNNTTSGYSEMAKQVQLNRDYVYNNAEGSIFYSSRNINGPFSSGATGVSGLGDYLKTNKYQLKSLTPVVTWKSHTSYNAPANAAYSSGKLTWTAVSNGKAIIRYSVYAVPKSVTSLEAAMASNGDGIDNKYLIGVSYTNSFSVPSAKQSNYWYAVCVYDGYGYEYTPAVVGLTVEKTPTVTLTSPTGGATVAWSQAFKWSAVSGATYTLQISKVSSFNDIKIEKANLSTNSATVDLSSLDENSSYYWRVIAQQSGKTPSTSSSATFKTPVIPTIGAATLTAPANGAEVDETIQFKWNAVSGVDQYTLQIASDNSFANIKYTSNYASSTTTANVNSATLGKGTWYWRIITKKNGYKDGTSAVRTFVVKSSPVGQTEAGYSVKRDPSVYNVMTNMTCTNLWMRSTKEGFGNISFNDAGVYNRGMVATNDYVYVSGRVDNKSVNSGIYLRRYNAETGEHMGDIILGDEAKVSYLPCNDVIKDSQGNICITNLVTNIESNPLKIFLVDVETGAVTLVASLTTSGNLGKRVDHAAIYGDVVSGNFTVFACLSSTTQVARWTFVNGTQTAASVATFSQFYPSSAANFGIAPRITPINENEFFISGSTNHFTRYNFSTKKMVSSFGSNSNIELGGTQANGGCIVPLGNKNIFVFGSHDETDANGVQFTAANAGGSYNHSDLSTLWRLPATGLGKVTSSTWGAPADYVLNNDSSATVYIYSPGNGLAAYKIKDEVSGVENISASEIEINVAGGCIQFNKCVKSVRLFNVAGMEISSANDVDFIEVPASGIYVVDADGARTKVSVK